MHAMIIKGHCLTLTELYREEMDLKRLLLVNALCVEKKEKRNADLYHLTSNEHLSSFQESSEI